MTFFKYIITVLAVCLNISAFAQYDQVEMADAMRSNGKIYVVVAVLSLILAGLFYYLFVTDKKITNLEKQQDSE